MLVGEDRYCEVNRAKVHYLFWKAKDFGLGQPPSLLLVHGTTAHAHWYDHMAPFLADIGFDVIAVDLSGFGDSETREGTRALTLPKPNHGQCVDRASANPNSELYLHSNLKRPVPSVQHSNAITNVPHSRIAWPELSVETWSADVHGVSQQEGLFHVDRPSKPVLVGHSLGAYACISTAMHHTQW